MILLATLGVLVLTSCEDEIAAPTLGRVEIHLASPTAGGINGAKVYWGDSLLVASVDRDSYSFLLPAGAQTLRLDKECSRIAPAASRAIQVEPGRGETLSWAVVSSQAIEVVSSMRGARIRLDGVDTGLITPATLGCVEPGAHRVSVSLLGASAGADSAKTVEVRDASSLVEFFLEPLPQARAGLVEVFTATFCPNCLAADAAAESLWSRRGSPDGYIGLQIHTRWGGADSLATPASIARNLLYRDLESGGIPAVVFSGGRMIRGADEIDVERIYDTYSAALDEVRSTPAAFAIHWLAGNREPGVRVTGRARVICLRDVAESEDIQVIAVTYKDGLVTRGIRGIESFRHVVREFKVLGSSRELALNHRGDWADVEMTFDLGGDRRRSGALWDEARMGLVLFLQGGQSKAVLQAAHITLP
jgi:hypothetical protein